MSFKQRENSEDWLSLADLSMGGFIIFLVLTMIFITRVPKQNAENLELEIQQLKQKNAELVAKLEQFDKQGKGNSDVILKNIADELKKEADKYDIEVFDNGAIRFKSNEELFSAGKSELSSTFKDKLSNFLGLYFQTIAKYQNKIAEVRIEGHTDTDGDYMLNLKLSQERAFNVLKFIRESDVYTNQYKDLTNILNKSIIANGYSYAKALDKNGNFINESGLPCDLDKSRRVEFKIFLKPSNE